MDVDEMVQGRQQSDGTVEQNKDLGKTVMEEKGGAREGRRKVGEVSQCAQDKRVSGKTERSAVSITTKREQTRKC